MIAAALAQPSDLRLLRRELRGLLLPGQRELHVKREKEPRQRQLAGSISRLPVEVHVYSRTCERQEEHARQACIERLACDLLGRGAQRLVLDSRAELDRNDKTTISAAALQHPPHTRFAYVHVDSNSESLLWVADTVAWCVGAGGQWRRRIDSIVGAVIDLD
ncbi:MAG TPA: hypothetical protein DGT23_19820 [Micromonosporaceae bacterium]|nr:hypothetical protein [Micromonosporaceae bacterium]